MAVAQRESRSTWLHLAALWSIAVAQPLLGPLGANPEFFIAHRAGALDILLLTATLVVLLPVVLVTTVGLLGLLGPRAQRMSTGLAIAALVFTLGMQVAVRLGVSTWFIAVSPASLAALGVVVAYFRLAPVRSFFTMLAAAIIVVPTVFLAAPGIRNLVLDPFRRSNILTPGATGRASIDTPVVLIVFDELPLVSLLDRHRDIDRALYPNLWALARDGVWFRNATAVNDFTRWAVPSILSGQYPRHSALPTIADHPDNLFTLLGQTHRLEVDETLTMLCPPRLCAAPGQAPRAADRLRAIGSDLRIVFLHATLTPDLTESLPKTTGTWAGFANDTTSPSENGDTVDLTARQAPSGQEVSRVRAVRDFIAGIDRTDPQPSFYFLHTLISHHPHSMLPGNRENKTAVEPPGKGGRGWGTDQPWAIAQQYQKQLLQTGFVDDLVGALVARLKDAGLYERSLVVITSDHGASFVPGTSQRSFSSRSAADIMRIPLIVKPPRGLRPPRPVSDANAESIDVLPTIADALDLAVPWRIDGSSLLDPARPERPTKTMFSGATGRRWSLKAAGPDLRPALRRKLALFGDGAENVYRVPRLPPFDGLVGEPVSALRVAGGGGQVELTHPWEFDRVDLSAEAIVFDVAGRFASPRPDTVVGVAVNAVLAAVTRTWESNPRGWLATPAFQSWKQGRNQIEVFAIERDAGGVLLRRTTFGGVRPAGLNLMSDAAREWGVVQSNFYGLEGTADQREFRWTRDWAELSNVFTHTPPRELDVEVAMVPGSPKRLQIQANDCTLFDGEVHGGWSRTLTLEPCATGRQDLTLRFVTDAPRGPVDRRRLGVAISRVVLRE